VLDSVWSARDAHHGIGNAWRFLTARRVAPITCDGVARRTPIDFQAIDGRP